MVPIQLPNFWMHENFVVIGLKFIQKGQTIRLFSSVKLAVNLMQQKNGHVSSKFGAVKIGQVGSKFTVAVVRNTCNMDQNRPQAVQNLMENFLSPIFLIFIWL